MHRKGGKYVKKYIFFINRYLHVINILNQHTAYVIRIIHAMNFV